MFCVRLLIVYELKDDMKTCTQLLLERGEIFLKKASKARTIISRFALPFISREANILTHSKSRVVLEILKEASNIEHFHVFVCESRPDKSGLINIKSLYNLKK
jgi:translation initiation factor eIF-2B subunit alpha